MHADRTLMIVSGSALKSITACANFPCEGLRMTCQRIVIITRCPWLAVETRSWWPRWDPNSGELRRPMSTLAVALGRSPVALVARLSSAEAGAL